MGRMVRTGSPLRRALRGAVVFLTVTGPIGLAGVAFSAPTPEDSEQAGRILEATGVQGGLVVHLGSGDGELTAALRRSESFLVHGLEADPKKVARARRHLRALGLYGEVTVERFEGKDLPYADDVVNLLVAERLGDVPPEEVTRVLAPGGVAYVKADSAWVKTTKPRPETMDDWTHYLHDASNNAVADDSRVGPPRRLRWACGPLWSRSHEFSSSLCAMVSANGRVFYMFDEGLTGTTARNVPERWNLIARDAFNGVLLWKRAVAKWGAVAWKKRALRSIPGTVPRRLVAEGDRVFLTLGYDAPVSALDAASGEVRTTYADTEGTQELRVEEGVLLAAAAKGSIVAIDTKEGTRLWRTEGTMRRFSLAAGGGRVFYHDGAELVCVGLRDGKRRWGASAKRPASLVLVHGDRVFLLGGQALRSLSASSGEDLWTARERVAGKELFVARDRIWHWEGQRLIGRDLGTGEIAARVDTDEVFTAGHHFRCYPSKATECFLITPNRGVEFVSLTGGEHTQSDWVRGPCAYGVMPCNGLLYVPPNPCFCYPGVKLTGFNVFAPAGSKGDDTRLVSPERRLETGIAYEEGGTLASSRPDAASPGAWPTYRHDGRRSGATDCEVPPEVSVRWRVRLGGSLTPPVASGGRVYVASKDTHTLHALDADNGEELWIVTAAGRIDSPPTVYGGLVLFGSADGRVSCLRASDGNLVWRFLAAPRDRRIVAFRRLESPWRVHGSVLIENGVAFVTAGRSSYLDGGIRILGLDPATGKVLHHALLDTWARTREDAVGKPFVPGYHMEGTQSDILVSEGGAIFLGQAKFDLELEEQDVPYVMPGADEQAVAMDLTAKPFVAPDENAKADYEKHQRDWIERTQKDLVAGLRDRHGGYSLGERKMGRHVLSTSGFLDDSWFNRTYWMYSETWPGFYLAHRAAKTGQLLVVGPERTYAVQAFPSRNLQSPLFTPGDKGYLLFADPNDNEPVLDHRTRETTKGWGFTRKEPPVWHEWVPVRIRGMVLAGERLFVAGPPDVVDPNDPMASFEGRRGATLVCHRASDGTKLAQLELEAPPVFDGLIAAAGRLFLSATDGTVIALGE